EGDAMTVARGIDTDADAVQGSSGGHEKTPAQGEKVSLLGSRVVQEACVSSGDLEPGHPRDKRSAPQDVPKPLCSSRREQSFLRGQRLRGRTALLTTLPPVWQNSWN